MTRKSNGLSEAEMLEVLDHLSVPERPKHPAVVRTPAFYIVGPYLSGPTQVAA